MRALFVVLLLVACGDEGRVGTSDASDANEVAPEDVALDAAADSAPEPDITPDTTSADSAIPDTAVEPDAAPDTKPADTAPEPDTAPADTVVADTAVEDTSGEAETSVCDQCSALRPVILVHGINGDPSNFDVMAQRMIADGWPEDYIVRFKAADAGWGCNVDNAAAIDALVDQTLARTCQGRVDIVAHSMGTLSSRYYIKNLGGTEKVNTYVTLGGMHHGLLSPCFAPGFLGVCVWQELCQSGAFITALNADPSTPGELHWVSIYGTADETVSNQSSHLDGAENIVIEGAEHSGENGLEQREDVYAEVKRVLGYDCW